MEKHRVIISAPPYVFTPEFVKLAKETYAVQFGVEPRDVEIGRKYIHNIKTKDTKKVSTIIVDEILNSSNIKATYENFIKENCKISLEDFWKLDRELNVKFDLPTSNNRSYKVEWIRAKNILSFGEVYRDYRDNEGVTLIHSNPKNQGGKTSLTRLIPILIWGNKFKFPSTKAVNLDFFNSEASGNEAYVEGVVSTPVGKYHLVRNFKRNKDKSKVSHKYKIYKYEDTAPYVEEIGANAIDITVKNAIKTLKIFEEQVGTFDDYSFAAFYNHDNMSQWIYTKGSERYTRMCDYLGLSMFKAKYDAAKKHFAKAITSLKKDNTIVNLQSTNEELKATNLRLQHEINNSRIELESLKEELKFVTQQIGIVGKQYKPLPDNYVGKNELINRKATLTAEYEAIESKIMDLELKLQALPNNIHLSDKNSLNEKILELDDERVNVVPSDYIQKQYDEAREDLGKDIDTSTYDEKIETLTLELEAIKGEGLVLKSKKNTLEETLGNMPETIVCPKCSTTTSNIAKIAEIRKDIKKLSKEITNKQRQYIEVRDTLSNTKLGKDKYVDKVKSTRNSAFMSAEKNLNTDVKNKIAHIQNYKSTLELELKNYLQYLSLSQSLAVNNELLGLKRNALKSVDSSIENHVEQSDIIAHNEGIDLQLKELQEKSTSLNSKISSIGAKISVDESLISRNIKDIDENLEKMQEFKDIIKRESDVNDYLFIHSEEGLSKHIILSILPSLNRRLDELLINLFNFRLEISYDNKKIEFNLVRNGIKKLIHLASGVELTVACLALHYVHISMTNLPIPSVLVLDEVMARVSKDNIKNIMPIVHRLKDVFSNIDIITHVSKDEFTEMYDYSILIERKNNSSKITKIEKHN